MIVIPICLSNEDSTKFAISFSRLKKEVAFYLYSVFNNNNYKNPPIPPNKTLTPTEIAFDIYNIKDNDTNIDYHDYPVVRIFASSIVQTTNDSSTRYCKILVNQTNPSLLSNYNSSNPLPDTLTTVYIYGSNNMFCGIQIASGAFNNFNPEDPSTWGLSVVSIKKP